jgi:NTP pyrophosphatase (non-canonical NTP hydrolase)
MNNMGENVVLNFATEMQKELDRNARKGYREGWKNCHLSWLLKRAKEEISELETAIDKKQDISNVISECADVANFVMMIADNYEKK